MKDKTVLFLHVPKTGGTMINSILESNFRGDFFQDKLFYADIYYQPTQIEDAIRTVRYKCLSSHALRAISVPPKRDDIIAFTFVRDPRELAISCYFDLRNRVSGQQHVSQKYEIDELTEKWKQGGFGLDYAYTVNQLRWLYPNVENRQDRLTNDISNGKFYLFPNSRFDHALVCLEKMFPAYFPDLSYTKRKNVSVKDYEVEERHRDAVDQLPWIESDTQLAKYSEQYLDGLISKLFPYPKDFEAYLENFYERGKSKFNSLDAKQNAKGNKIYSYLRSISKSLRL
ncbi:MAG: sulfotransferase family 2 domain-containing protein [Bacteroidota bacterium]